MTKHIITNYFYTITDYLYIISECLSTFGSYDLLASKTLNCNCVEIMSVGGVGKGRWEVCSSYFDFWV